MNWIISNLNYVVVVVLMMTGLFIIFSSSNLVRRMIGLALLQSSTGLFYISLSKVSGATAAITIPPDSAEARALASQLDPEYISSFGINGVVYANPLPHVLILTAIVVGVATLAVGLAIAVRVREAFGTVEAPVIEALSRDVPVKPEDAP